MYSIEVENKFEQLIDEGDDVTWESMKTSWLRRQKSVYQRKREVKIKWMTQEILSMMNDRWKIKNRDS